MFNLKRQGGLKNVRVEAFDYKGEYFFANPREEDLLDLVFVCDATRELGADVVADSAWRALRLGGRIALVEPAADAGPLGDVLEARGFLPCAADETDSLQAPRGYAYRVLRKPDELPPEPEPEPYSW